MNWISRLLDPLLDRLATKLAQKIEIELDAAIDAALDQTDDRIRDILKGAEDRLVAAAGQGIASVAKLPAEAKLSLQQGVPTLDVAAVAGEEIRAVLRRQVNPAGQSPLFREVPDR
jgi:hypothetical protein